MDIIPSQNTNAPKKESNLPPGAPGQMPLRMGFHMDGAKQQLLGAINARRVTDRPIPIIWALLPLIIYLVGFVAMIIIMMVEANNLIDFFSDTSTVPSIDEIFAALALTIIIGIVWTVAYYVLYGILTYMLIDRHNEHFERESHLRMGIMSFLRAAAGSPEKEAIISSEIATMNILHSEAQANDIKRTAVLWALAIGFLWVPIWSFIGMILSLYMFYFLMKNIYNHDRRWHDFMGQTYSALTKLGYSYTPVFGVQRLERRSFVLYFVLSIITLGFFVLYWWYTFVKDLNEHYKYQWYVEDHLANTIGQK